MLGSMLSLLWWSPVGSFTPQLKREIKIDKTTNHYHKENPTAPSNKSVKLEINILNNGLEILFTNSHVRVWKPGYDVWHVVHCVTLWSHNHNNNINKHRNLSDTANAWIWKPPSEIWNAVHSVILWSHITTIPCFVLSQYTIVINKKKYPKKTAGCLGTLSRLTWSYIFKVQSKQMLLCHFSYHKR